MSRHLLLACTLPLLLLILPGCDGAEDDGDFRGSLVLPDRTTSIVGKAYFSETGSGDDETFVLFFTPNDLDDFDDPEFRDISAVVILQEGNRPGPGVYPLFDPEDGGAATAFYLSAPTQQTTATLIAETGSFTIDEFEDDEFQGSFTFSGPLLDPALPDGVASATVRGEFGAVRILPSTLPGLTTSLPTSR